MKTVFSIQILRTLFPNFPPPPEEWSDSTIMSVLADLLDQPPTRTKLPLYNSFADAVELFRWVEIWKPQYFKFFMSIQCKVYSYQWFRNSKNILVLTGAGVSVSCGIPDFRSKDGIYARLHLVGFKFSLFVVFFMIVWRVFEFRTFLICPILQPCSILAISAKILRRFLTLPRLESIFLLIWSLLY